MRFLSLTVVTIVCGVLAQSCGPEIERFTVSEDKLHTLVGIKRNDTIVFDGVVGFIAFGPYVGLKSGLYRIDIEGSLSADSDIYGTFDVVAGSGKRTYTSVPLRVLTPSLAQGFGSFAFYLPQDEEDVEFRILVSDPGASGEIRGYILSKLGK